MPLAAVDQTNKNAELFSQFLAFLDTRTAQSTSSSPVPVTTVHSSGPAPSVQPPSKIPPHTVSIAQSSPFFGSFLGVNAHGRGTRSTRANMEPANPVPPFTSPCRPAGTWVKADPRPPSRGASFGREGATTAFDDRFLGLYSNDILGYDYLSRPLAFPLGLEQPSRPPPLERVSSQDFELLDSDSVTASVSFGGFSPRAVAAAARTLLLRYQGDLYRGAAHTGASEASGERASAQRV